MTVPDDAGRVRTAIRLGWSIAEVRGRNRPDAPPGARAMLPGPPGRALPLHVEQTSVELRIEAQNALNHPVFGTPNTSVDDPSFGQISYTSVGPREVQLAIKFNF